MAGQRQAVLAGHHDVADDQIDGLRAQHRARLGGAGGIDDGKALRAQIFGERLADRRFVVDQQDARRIAIGHRLSLDAGVSCVKSASLPMPFVSSEVETPVGVAQGRWVSRLRSRSEEHTSELQSLMRHSYAVFCLKTKTN